MVLCGLLIQAGLSIDVTDGRHRLIVPPKKGVKIRLLVFESAASRLKGG